MCGVCGGPQRLHHAIAAALALCHTRLQAGAAPLYVSAQNGHLEVVKSLVAARANTDLARVSVFARGEA